MTFSSIIKTLSRSPLTDELLTKLQRVHRLRLNGLSRFPKGLITSTLAQCQDRNLLVVTATLEEGARWTAQLEAMGWQVVHFYPTSEASPYNTFAPESEMIWGQMQVLADLTVNKEISRGKIAVVATERSLQPHLPPLDIFEQFCLQIKLGESWDLKGLSKQLALLGYERVNLVETEGQWSRRGDIIDIFPVASELPVRLEWFGDDLEKIREFDPANQRSLDQVDRLILTPTDFGFIVKSILKDQGHNFSEKNDFSYGRFLGIAFDKPACLLDYLPENTLIVIDEPEQCAAHSDRWFEHSHESWLSLGENQENLPQLHRRFQGSLTDIKFDVVEVSELVTNNYDLNLASRPFPGLPHQFAKLAQNIREERKRNFSIFILSAQPSRSVSLLQEHDCSGQFIPNPRDYQAIDKLNINHVPIALKYSGLAELEGFILPTFRLVVVTDKEFFGQHSLATPSYIRKRRRATSKQVDPNKLKAGDYVVHRQHGIGKFLQLESLTINNETREYIAIQYADGLLRVPADQMASLSRFRAGDGKKPELNKMTGKTWENTKNKVRKTIKKLAVDLIKLYAQRAQQKGFSFPPDYPWQRELEESFPYQPTPDQLKATQEVKRDMESPTPMDRLVCGDVGFGKTEVAIRAIFKAVTAGKQVAFLAPTTILTQQHYHSIKERFAPYPIEIGLLNRFRSNEEKKVILQRLAAGELDVVVGTHQLLGKEVNFKDLGLLVIDEEQRFGVNQKEKIKSLKTQLDVLTLTATPIPRTLYMSLSGIREMSLITTPPPSRRPIKTHLNPYDPEAIRTAIRQELDRGGQVFYVVPRVEGIEEKSAKLREMIPDLKIAIAHGQLDEAELEGTMLAFNNGEADLLICTTIIESGLDIPRVNTILIEDANRFGLSQLYQLRGRVGRAGIQAHAWLFYPANKTLSDDAKKRLRAIQEFTQLGSGYQLAMRDMEIRGVGNLLGAEQSGQLNAIGFDLYAEMLQEAINEIKGEEMPQVDDTQIDLNITAFIPGDYILDLEQKMTAYRAIAAANNKKQLTQIAAEWSDRYGTIPKPVQQLIKVIELKQIAKKLAFSRIKPEGKQHIILETPMAEPAWKILQEKLPNHLRSRFVYQPKKVIVRGLGSLPADQQLDYLIDWLDNILQQM
jgi:transcription-repair coupling factor (superfamily II helicase)